MWNFGILPATLMLGLLARADAQVPDIPLLPSRDLFYTPQASDWATKDLGEILDSRRVNIDFAAIPNASVDYDAFQLLYVTSDLQKQKTTSVTTVIVPRGANMSRILSYQIAYDAPDINCSPSYGLQPGANAGALPFTRAQMDLIAGILVDDHPPVLNIADYEGSNAAFTVGPQSAYQTLDSIRAATASGSITGVDASADIVLFGYSGGGYASEWTVEFHSDYAPDVNIIGAAMGGLPTNITQVYENMHGFFSPLNVWAVLGVMNAYDHIDKWIQADLKPDRLQQFLGPRQRCSEPENPPSEIPAIANINSWFKHGKQFLTEFKHELEDIGIMGQRILPGSAPKFPLYIFRGLMDRLTSPHRDTVALKEKYCQEGSSVSFVVYPLQTHVPASKKGSPIAMEWIKKVFNREEVPNDCGGPAEVA